MSPLKTFVDRLNQDYEKLHIAKEDAFWQCYMGLTNDAEQARADFNEKEIELQRWLQSPEQLQNLRGQLENLSARSSDPSSPSEIGANGWMRTFEANVIESAEARRLAEEIIEDEGKLAQSRAGMSLGYQVKGGDFVPASSVKLGNMLRSEKDESLRKAAWQGLSSIETHVLQNGFIDIVKKRNRLGRMLGGEDYYDWKVRGTEGMTKKEIFALLDELEIKTRARASSAIAELNAQQGNSGVTPWNIQYLIAGDVTALLDPYFPFAKSLRRWGESFSAMKVDYRQATLALDLLDRKGKHENGFMHCPEPAWRKDGSFRPARIHFTANAIPGQIGAGHRSLATFLHEGGHASHFANIDMPAPCFAQEFAPTSVAFAEIQSMFMDNLMNDADWLTRYAQNLSGEPISFDLIERDIAAKQPFAAWSIRAMMVVPYVERAIYELPESELTPENIIKTMRTIESKITGIAAGSHRPVLSVPHLLSGEASAYYHGYVMAEMGVHQTRDHFMQRDGYLADNPAIGPDLSRHYWQPGNSLRLNEFLQNLTGGPLSPNHLAAHANRTVEQAISAAKGQIKHLKSRPRPDEPVELNATIRVAHGNSTITDSSAGFENCAKEFESWIALLV